MKIRTGYNIWSLMSNRPGKFIKGKYKHESKVKQAIVSDIFCESFDDFLSIKCAEYSSKRKINILSSELQCIQDQEASQLLYELLLNDEDLVSWADGNTQTTFYNPVTFNVVRIRIRNSSVNINIDGEKPFIDKYKELILSILQETGSTIKWIYDDKGSYVDVPLDTSKQPIQELYPFLGDINLEDYYNMFITSDAAILILIGPPGTGKTSFVKGMIDHSKSSAMITYNIDQLDADSLFVEFIENQSCNFLIIEDCDTLISSRTDGNNIMHRFLNVSDGIVKTKNKKIIFTTNLPDVKDIDEALIRPGRCFDVVNFQELTRDQAEILAKKFDKTIREDKESYTIADVLSEEQKLFSSSREQIQNKMGFRV